MMDVSGYRAALTAAGGDGLWAEVNAHENGSMLVCVVNGEVERTAANLQTALYVRAGGEQTGVAYTQDAEENPTEVIRRAVENGKYGEGGSTDVLLEAKQEHCARETSPAAVETLVAIGKEACEQARLQTPDLQYVKAEVRADTWRNAVVNSKGLDVDASRQVYCAALSAMAQRAGKQYNAQAHVTAATPEGLQLRAAAARVAQAMERQFEPVRLQSGAYPTVLDSSVVINIFTTAWQLFAATKVLGGSSAFYGRLGHTIGSKALTVTDRAAREGCGYVFPVDDEGASGQDTALMRNGVLTGLLHTGATAEKMGVKRTGNSGRVALLTGSIPTELIPVPKILCVEPGQRSRAELLASMGDGVLIAQSFDVFHSINIGSGDFSIPCRGSVVRDGVCAYNVTGLTLSGNLNDLFANVEAAGNDLWIDEFLLKSYCIGAPSLQIRQMQVNGKG
ncbi:MAG TPA: TldD/PmbA family protein [Candidatus Limiplasma sp.]|mgnify:CR=1 FL=1|nr:TldD/PmbA family protein [Candidatus Limiplasma sp.]HPS81449.1 TldD/PmbA family protein [Candidatus Limiplasma sp.]